jgi:translation initiation factor IF-1
LGPAPEVLDGVIEEVLPKALYRVRLASGATITASLASTVRRVTIQFLPGDHVLVEISRIDPTRGRIQARN